MNSEVHADPAEAGGDELMPTCDGVSVFEFHGDPHAEMKRAFAQVYRAVNACAHKLRQARSAVPFNPADERSAAQAMERALVVRDALENKYAQVGIVATPMVKGGFVRDIQFATPRAQEEKPSMISMCFRVMPVNGHVTRKDVDRLQ